MAIHIVLADDHPVVRSGIRALIGQAPDLVVVGEADSGVEALRLVEEYAPDVLLLDMEMPGITGIEVARHLHEVGSRVRVLGLSAYDDEQYIFALLESRAAGYLTKDEAEEQIVDAVRGVARGDEGWFSRRVMAKVARLRTARMDTPGPLSEREQQVLQLVARGDKNEQIAEVLRITDKTVKNHITNIFRKLGVSTRTQASVWAWHHGLVNKVAGSDG